MEIETWSICCVVSECTALVVWCLSISVSLWSYRLRTKLPELFCYYVDDLDVLDRDVERNEKGEVYSDKRRRAHEADNRAGDQVLVKHDRENMLSTAFNR